MWAWTVATFFGAGFGKPGPGTWGSVAAVLLWAAYAWLAPSHPAHPAHSPSLAGIALTLLLGIPAATIVARESGRNDPQFVVIDEVAGQWIALLFSPADWRHALIALVLFRLFDITKPFPVRQLENLPEGWGIVFDDVAAGLYALGVASLLAPLDLESNHAPQPAPNPPPQLLPEPRIDDIVPAAALPLGEVELIGAPSRPVATAFWRPARRAGRRPPRPRPHEPPHAPRLPRPRAGLHRPH